MKLSKLFKNKSKEKPSKENVSATGTPSKNSSSNPSTPNPAGNPSKFQNLKGKCTPMMAVVIFLVIALVGVVTTLLVLQLKNKSDTWNIINQYKNAADAAKAEKAANAANEVKTCRTPECIQLAYQLHNFGNPKIDPCLDFYKASCSRYVEHSSSNVDRGSEKIHIVVRLLKSYLESNTTGSTISEVNMKKLYVKCLSATKATVRATFYREILANIGRIGWWPLLDSNSTSNSRSSTFNLNDMLINMAQLNITEFGLFSLQNAGKIVLAPDELHENLERHLNIMVGARVPSDAIQRQVQEAENFGKQLSRLAGQRLVFARYADTPQMQMVDIDGVLRIVIGAGGRLNVGSVIDKIYVLETDFFFGTSQNLDTILQSTPKETIANFLIFKYISTMVENLESMKDCTNYVITKLPQASLRYFTRNFFDRANMVPATEIVDELRTSYKEMFEKSTWLSESTKQNAIRKVEKMKFLLGVPDDEGWEDYVDTIHEKLTLGDSDSLHTSTINVVQFFLHNELESFDHNAKINPGYNLLTGNAQYLGVANELAIMAPYLLPPQFDDSHPKYAQLASTGVVLGHEIGHGFDRKGAQHDENGDEKNWWKPEDATEYMNRTQCLVNQYSNYDDPDYGRNLNGKKTIGEMTSDKLGIEASWKAYKRSDASSEPRIIGFEDEPLDKVFFRLYALTWCSPPSRISLQNQLTKVHPTKSFRVNGLLQGFKPFADAFNCPLGSPMNPRDKCQIF